MIDKKIVIEIAHNTGLWDFFECHEQNDGDVRMLVLFAEEIIRCADVLAIEGEQP